MEIQGVVKLIEETKTYGSNGFRKREMVLTTEETYPQHILIEFVQDRTDLLDPLRPGDKVNVSINLRGREWTSPQGEVKYFNSIQGWRIEKVQNDVPGPEAAPPAPPMNTYESTDNGNDEDYDDLPF